MVSKLLSRNICLVAIIGLEFILLGIVLVGCTQDVPELGVNVPTQPTQGQNDVARTTSPLPITSTLTHPPSLTQKTEGGDYMWMNYYALQQPSQIWIRVDETGSGQVLEYVVDQKRVLSARVGQLDRQNVQDLFRLVDDIGFFNFNDRYEPSPGMIYEGDIVSVSVKQGDRVKLVVARPPEFIPEGLMELVQKLEEDGANLPSVSLDKIYLRAQFVEPSRAQDIAASGQFTFTTLNDQELLAIPALKTAVDALGEFVAAGDGEEIQQGGFDAPYGYFFLDYRNSTYEVTIFSTK